MSRIAVIENRLRLRPEDLRFSDDHLAGLPEPVQRYFHHAIARGTPLARSVWLRQTGSMRPRREAARLELVAEETLAPPFGMVWRAETHIGPIPMRIVDSHFEGRGRLRGTVLGFPVMQASGTDVSRSSRHRLAAESVWIPSALLPVRGVTWTAQSDMTIQARLSIDNEEIEVRLALHPTGAVHEITMQRFGNVRVPDWDLIPYGFVSEAETTFGGYTIPLRMRGGWWYGTDRYDPDGASDFNIEDARYT